MGKTTHLIFSLLLFWLDLGSGIRDPRSGMEKNTDLDLDSIWSAPFFYKFDSISIIKGFF